MREFTHQFRAMGTQVGLWLWHDNDPLASKVLAQTEQFFIRTESHLSRFKADSELSRLTRAAGRSRPGWPTAGGR